MPLPPWQNKPHLPVSLGWMGWEKGMTGFGWGIRDPERGWETDSVGQHEYYC